MEDLKDYPITEDCIVEICDSTSPYYNKSGIVTLVGKSTFTVSFGDKKFREFKRRQLTVGKNCKLLNVINAL